MNKLISAVSPHFHTPRNTTKIMLDVIIALCPAAVASVIIPAEKNFGKGQKVTVGLKKRGVFVFDAETGERLA